MRFFYLIDDIPPIYGINAAGIRTVPSSFKLFSKKAISILGGATTVLFYCINELGLLNYIIIEKTPGKYEDWF